MDDHPAGPFKNATLVRGACDRAPRATAKTTEPHPLGDAAAGAG